jgi:hypothetical protein
MPLVTRRTTEQHTDKVTVLEVVTVQLVARLLRIHHVLIDDEGGALGVARNALSNLTIMSRVRMGGFGTSRAERVDIPDGPVLPKEIEQLLWSDVVAGRRSEEQGFVPRIQRRGCENTHLRFFTNKALSMNAIVSQAVCNASGEAGGRMVGDGGGRASGACAGEYRVGGETRRARQKASKRQKRKRKNDSPIYLRAKFVGSTHISMSM